MSGDKWIGACGLSMELDDVEEVDCSESDQS